MMGGYRISNDLKQDLAEISQSAEACRTIAETANLDVQDRKTLRKNTIKIKKLATKWIGE